MELNEETFNEERMQMKRLAWTGLMAMVAMTAAALSMPVVDVTKVGAEKKTVTIDVADPAFAKCLRRNLEISGLFQVQPNAAIKVSGAAGAITAEGNGKRLSCTTAFADEKAARMAARKLSDAMCEAYGQQKGFACDRVVFINRGQQVGKDGTIPGELCVGYPDGSDIRQVTGDKAASIFPRWKNANELLYIGYLKGAPQILELDTATGKRKTKWSFKGTPAGIAVSPDGTRVAAILSFQGNPELYVVDMASGAWTRLTTTPLASEGQPTWSPDGRKIAYVSNETRHPQIYVIDVATKEKRRLTSKGRENIDPDWGKDGNIVYITKRGGAQVAVMSPAEGDATARLVTQEANWEHPSWSRDMRHVVANRDQALFIIDTLEGGDGPVQMFHAAGNWISPSWSK